MLEALKRSIGVSKDSADLTEMANVQEALAAANLLVQTKDAELSSVLEKLTSYEADMSAMASKLEAALTQVAQAEEFSKALAEKAMQDKNDKRKAKLESLIGTAKADATLAATASLEDVAFDAVCAALETTLSVEEESFKEVGASVVADTNASGLSPEAKMLQALYNK